MGTLGFVAAALIAIAAGAHLIVIVFAVRAAISGRQSAGIARALGISFGTLVFGVGMFAASFELDVARAVGIAVSLTGLTVVALAFLPGRRSR